MLTFNHPNTEPVPHRVLRALWLDGTLRAVGDVVKLPRLLACELRAAGKVEAAPTEPEPAEPKAKKAG